MSRLSIIVSYLITGCGGIQPRCDVDFQGRNEKHLLSWKESSDGPPNSLMWTAVCKGMRLGGITTVK